MASVSRWHRIQSSLPLANRPQQPPTQPRAYSQAYLPNGNPSTGPTPGATPLLPNQGRVVQAGGARVLCIADVRGRDM